MTEGVETSRREERSRETRARVEVELAVARSKTGNENLLTHAMYSLYIQAYFLG